MNVSERFAGKSTARAASPKNAGAQTAAANANPPFIECQFNIKTAPVSTIIGLRAGRPKNFAEAIAGKYGEREGGKPQKKSAAFQRADPVLFKFFYGRSGALRELGRSLDNLALYALEPVAASDFSGELYQKLVDGLVHVVACDADYHIGALDFEAAFRRELVVVVFVGLVRKLYPQPYDAVVVNEELLHFIHDVLFQRICEFEVLSRYDDFVVAHVFLLSVFVFGKPARGNPEAEPPALSRKFYIVAIRVFVKRPFSPARPIP